MRLQDIPLNYVQLLTSKFLYLPFGCCILVPFTGSNTEIINDYYNTLVFSVI